MASSDSEVQNGLRMRHTAKHGFMVRRSCYAVKFTRGTKFHFKLQNLYLNGAHIKSFELFQVGIINNVVSYSLCTAQWCQKVRVFGEIP